MADASTRETLRKLLEARDAAGKLDRESAVKPKALDRP